MKTRTTTLFTLWAVALACISGGIVAGIASARARAVAAERDLLREEARIAVALVRVTGDTGSLRSVFGDRWSLTADVDPLLDEPVVGFERGLGVATASVYDADSWFQTGTLRLFARPESPVRIPARVTLVGIASALLIALLTGAWIRRVSRSAGTTVLIRVLLVGVLVLSVAVPLVETHNWTRGRLQDATEHRMSAAEGALRSATDLETLVLIPGVVSQLTGMSAIVLDSTGTVVSSALPASVTEALAIPHQPFRGRATADRVEYALTDVPPVRLAALPYEHSGPGPAMVALGLLGVLLATLPLSLARLTNSPRIYRRNLIAWSFLAPSLAHLLVFTAGPLAFAAWLSFHRWSLIDAARPFVGVGNYVRVLGDPAFWNAIANTVVFTLHVPVSMALALGLALLVHRGIRGIVVLRAMLFLPTITSLVAIAMVWQWMLHDEYGLINWMLSAVGIAPVRWLSSPSTALVSIMIMAVWMLVGYQMILFQAGLAAIPSTLYDAARIDGAGPWNRFVHVTIPGLRHTLFFVLITSVIGSFQVFGAVYVMTEGGPLRSTDVVVFHIYREAWEFLRFGDAAAMSWVLFSLIFVVTWLQFRLLEQRFDSRSPT